MPPTVTLDGFSLSIADVVAVARHGAPVAIAPHSLTAVTASRRSVEAAVARGDTIYGVNTGFGKLAHVRIKPEQTRELQLNLIRSHASGVGDPLAVDAVRAMMLLRANVLVRGTRGSTTRVPTRSSSARRRCCASCWPAPRSGSRTVRTTRASRTPTRCVARP